MNVDRFCAEGKRNPTAQLPASRWQKQSWNLAILREGAFVCGHLPAPIRQERAASADRGLPLEHLQRGTSGNGESITNLEAPIAQRDAAAGTGDQAQPDQPRAVEESVQVTSTSLGGAMIHFLTGSPTSPASSEPQPACCLNVTKPRTWKSPSGIRRSPPWLPRTNATRVFWGTAWTSKTLLARELRAARLAEKKDGIRRTWVLTADEVGAEVPAYKTFVEEQVARLGRNNPLVRTQYFSEEIDSEGGMFPLSRRALMMGGHAKQIAPTPGRMYVFTIDVAGQDEGAAAGPRAAAEPEA